MPTTRVVRDPGHERSLRCTDMSVPQRFAGYLRLLRFVGRIAAIVLVWILVVGIATVCFFPPGLSIPASNSEDWAFIDNALVFGSSMTIAGTFAPRSHSRSRARRSVP